MARLYAPDAYGLLGLYTAFTGILAVPASLQYHGAVLLPKTDTDALALFKAGFLLSLVTTTVLALLLLLQLDRWLIATKYEAIIPWLPVIVLMITPGVLITFAGLWLTRKRQFALLSIMRLVMTLSSTAIGMTLGYFSGHMSGLIIGSVVGTLLGGSVLAFGMHKTNAIGFLSVESKQSIDMVRKYRDFPLYATPTQFLMQLSRQAPVLLLTGMVGTNAVGFFNMSNRLLGLPNALFAESLSTVFSQRAAKHYAETGNCRILYQKMFWGLLLTTTPLVLLLAFTAPVLFAWLLGERWRVAGEYSQILCWLFAVQLVCTPLSSMMTIARRQNENMWLQIVSCITTIALMYGAFSWFGTAKAMLVGFTIAATATQLYYGIRGFWLSNPVRSPTV